MILNPGKRFYLVKYSDNDSFKGSASLTPVAAFDGSKGYSFESALLRGRYMCYTRWMMRRTIKFGKLHGMTRSYAENNAKRCSWDLQVIDKDGIFSNRTYEDMQYSMKGPEVLGKEMGISSGDDFVHRTQDVLTSRTLGWIEGLPWNASCTPTGDRCSMGLVCKNSTCQILSSSAGDSRDDVAPTAPIEDTPALPSDIGSLCDPNVDIPCSNGMACVQQGQKHFCVPESDSPTARWVTEQNSGGLYSLFGASKSESSSLSAWEYSTRGQTIVDIMEKDWSKGVSENDLCEHSEARCSLGLVCIVAIDNRRRCSLARVKGA